MRALTTELERPARRAKRAGRSALKTAQAVAEAIVAEHLAYARKSSKHLKRGAGRAAKDLRVIKDAGQEAGDIGRERLREAMEGLQQASADLSRWAGGKAAESRVQAGELVRRRPAGSVAVLLGAGVLIGLLASLALRDSD